MLIKIQLLHSRLEFLLDLLLYYITGIQMVD